MPKTKKTKKTKKVDKAENVEKGKGIKTTTILLVAFAVCTIVIFGVSIRSVNDFSVNLETVHNGAIKEFLLGMEPTFSKSPLSEKAAQAGAIGASAGAGFLDESELEGFDDIEAELGGSLSCDAYGGPSEEAASEMVYWSDIPTDSKYMSPLLHRREGDTKKRLYMAFEPDGGGWNNIRMAMETYVGLAAAMGRTLVMPPQKKMYLLGKDKGHDQQKQRKHFDFADFFPMEELAKDNAALDVISMKEFLETEAMAGNLVNKETGKPSFPPNNRTDWDGSDQKEYDELRFWLRTVAHVPMDWNPGRCLAAFPASGNHQDVEELQKMQDKIHRDGVRREQYVGNPVNVTSSPMDRMKENLAGRRNLCVYDEKMQQQFLIHFICSHKDRVRMLVHFYCFIFMEDWREDLWMKRFIRDHVRYTDEIQCAAARIVNQMREIARKRDPIGNPNGEYDSFHIRRGDFQFKQSRIPAEEIVANTKAELTPNSTIFIATDEREKSFFEPLKKLYDVHFMDEFVQTELKGVNTNYYGMIDQLVASRGRIFFGCWWSTFTGFIMRMRGYHSVKGKLPGYQDGTLPTTYYYATMQRKFEMHTYAPINSGFFQREYPVSWRDLNYGIEELPLPDATSTK